MLIFITLNVMGQYSTIYDPTILALDKNCTNMPIWPYPKYASQGKNSTSVLSPNFKFTSTKSIKTLEKAFERYEAIIFPFSVDNETNESDITDVRVHVHDESEVHLQIEIDESYVLDIPMKGAVTITAQTIYGALRGLETLSQLVKFRYTHYEIQNTPWHIQDAPRFPHRGVMIDTSRHFLPLVTIRRVIDSLVHAKLNVLHWHMTDDPSFPMQSRSHPTLWKGSFSKGERYMLKDIEKVIEYARLRGVRVIVEFDMPGHNRSWCKGLPDLCPAANCNSPMDVSSNKTFQVIQDILHEITNGEKRNGLFPDDFIHLGGDEVNTKCWETVPHVKRWLQDRNFTADDAYMYFVKRVADIAISQGRRPIQWVEVFDHFGQKLDKRVVVHVWKDKDTLKKVVAAGYNALLSNSGSLYLDHLKISWDTFYLDDPHEGIYDIKQQALIFGGQAEMWGETVDGSDIEATIWPRAAAFAERLWSPRHISSTVCALPRLQRFRCLLLSRGVSAAPVTNWRARLAPKGPGSCFI